ncbi:MAG: 4a-hydroxytetrahydrobiopterin dehydratase [Myxococcales bacterium]|nr:4a-hydroxytetrahydrobiopterin dehydratase [Myxococcales bacterium]
MPDVLSSKHCVPCMGGVQALSAEQCAYLLRELGGEWQLVDGHHLSKTFAFENFIQALDFVNRVGELAESEGHHPDILLSWGKVRLDIWTHKIDGLTESDFILAAKSDQLREPANS